MKISVFAITAFLAFTMQARDLLLWYRQPATNALNEGLPIGNGRLGALVCGAVEQECLILNEDSLWTGDENPSGDYDNMGAYQLLGKLKVQPFGFGEVSGYRRELDLNRGLARVIYAAGGTNFEREFFCSYPAGVLVARFSSDRPVGYRIEMEDSHGAPGNPRQAGLTAAGQLSNGLKYEWQVAVVSGSGIQEIHDSSLVLNKCRHLIVIVGGGTDYAMDAARGYRGENPHLRISAQVESAVAKPYPKLKSEHLRDFQSFFKRAAFDLGQSSEARRAQPTDQRKTEAVKNFDPELEQLLFQYGRYLLISSSRPGGLPANLQGLWNDSNDPPWHCDYHANINVQMNYWPGEVANLAECHSPFFDLVVSQLPAWRRAASASEELKTPAGALTRRGFAIRTSHNIMGGLGWKWDKTANAWYCQHFWEHFAFGQDKDFLRRVAYPLLKETCEYWEDHLKELPNGKLVVPNGWSPEHGPDEEGVSYNQEIVWDLFNNYVQACDCLGIDQDYRARVAVMRDRLVTPGIGTWGQLLEWMTEKQGHGALPQFPELDTPGDHHRHTSHLFAVYPGAQISQTRTPALAAAAKVSLDARGIAPDSDVREWSFAWRSALYARLHDGDSAHRMLQQLFSARNTCPNLFGLHPPMQIDGNFGITAGICEMLVQSQTGEIELLPALPTAWQKGSVKGLRARGGFEIDLDWTERKLNSVILHSLKGGACTIRYGSKVVRITIRAGESRKLGAQLRD